jgi:hypothetical protein
VRKWKERLAKGTLTTGAARKKAIVALARQLAGWKLPKRIQAPHRRGVLSPVVGVVTPAESLQERRKHDAEATRVGLSTATRKASASLAERDGDEVVYVSARLKDVVSSAAQLHGWNQPADVNVNIANIPMPTAEERAEMTAIDRKLDAIAAKLKNTARSATET